MNLILVIGTTGKGKTPWVSSKMRNGYKPNPKNANKSIQTVSSKSLRQYVFDINNEYLFPLDNKILPQMRHINADVRYFMATCKTLRNTNIIFEDATGFLRGKQTASFIQLVQGKIHTGNNYIILFHSINRVPPELMELSNLIVLFPTVDNVEVVDKKFKNPTLNAAYLELRKNPSKKFLTIKPV